MGKFSQSVPSDRDPLLPRERRRLRPVVEPEPIRERTISEANYTPNVLLPPVCDGPSTSQYNSISSIPETSSIPEERSRPSRSFLEMLMDPESFLHRIIALVLMCFLGFGSYFCFDNPGALQSELKTSMNITTAQFATLYSWYSWPNVVLPIVGGFFMDRVFGIRLGTMIFAFIIVIGQLLFSFGGFMNRMWMMEIGRFVFGIGGESLAVAQNTYAVAWFKGKELNMVFGFQLSVARVGSTVNFMVMSPLFEYINSQIGGTQETSHTAIGWTLLLAGLLCIMSFTCSLLLGLMDKRRTRLLAATQPPQEENQVVQLRDIITFPLPFWFLCLACLAYYGAIFPFVSLAKDFFRVQFGMDGVKANFITGMIYLVSAPASPALGYLLDKTGRNITWVFLSIVGSIGCHCLLAFTSLNPYISMSALGLFYSLLASALWPIAALLVPEAQLGTAYGLMQAIQNLGTALIILAAGSIADDYGYVWLEVFFIFWLILSLLSTLCIWFYDCSKDGYLNMSIERRQVYEREREARAEAERRASEVHRQLLPKSDTEIRNRYLYKVGAEMPDHLREGYQSARGGRDVEQQGQADSGN